MYFKFKKELSLITYRLDGHNGLDITPQTQFQLNLDNSSHLQNCRTGHIHK